MVPIKLKLSNFTSYGESPPELDFSQFKLAAISGFNGAGKSSLLDAITWNLWGASRAGDSSDALIRLGTQQMFVEFDFELDGHIYTVKRKRNKKSGGNSALEFWSNSHNLTEGTIKATQQKIIDTLHLTYETFTNSSFIRQGHADEFTTKGPTDRKRILADILGLDHYDKLEEKAKEKAKEAQTKLTLLDYQLLEIEAELSYKEDQQQNFNKLQVEVENKQKELKELEFLIKTIEDEKQAIQITINTLSEQQQRYKDLEKELVEFKTQIELKQRAQQEFQIILDKRELIETNYNKLQKLQEEKKSLETERTELIKTKDELVLIEKQINNREDKRKEAIAKLEIQLKEYQTITETLETQNEKLIRQKTICPTCGQNIGEEKNQEIIAKNIGQIEKNKKLIDEINIKITKFESVVLPEYEQAKQKQLEIKKIEEGTKNYLEVNSQISDLAKFEQGYLKLQQAEIAIQTHREALEDLQEIYHSKELEQQKAKSFIEDLEKYQQKYSEVTQKLLSQVILKDSLSQQILELTGQVGQAKQLIDRAKQLENLNKQKQQEKQDLTKQKEGYEELSLAFGKKGIQAMIIEQAIPEIEDEANNLLEKLTEGRMKVSFVTQKETKTKVMGVEGKKDFATVETLDIIISDEMGERPYEMYSGGESFRVNFAIRLAISKLLTHRAGAKLQFLVIDEGFGTQDATGRTRLVEVLDTIKNDFEKILIITHLEELKEEFPTRIEVFKNAGGSTFEVVGS